MNCHEIWFRNSCSPRDELIQRWLNILWGLIQHHHHVTNLMPTNLKVVPSVWAVLCFYWPERDINRHPTKSRGIFLKMSPITFKLASPQMIRSFSRWPSPDPCSCLLCWVAPWYYHAWCLWHTRRRPPPPTVATPCYPSPGSSGASWLMAEKQRSWWPAATGWESARLTKTEPRC